MTAKLRVRTAQVTARAFEINCPRCGSVEPAPDSGSLFWDENDLIASAGKVFGCGCGERFRVSLRGRPTYPTGVMVHQ